MFAAIFQDWAANRGNLRSQLALALFRLARQCHGLPVPIRWVGWPCLAVYTMVVGWLLGIELPYAARIGPGLRLYHGVGTVLHKRCVLGGGCVLRQCTTIGNRRGGDDVPVIGDGVDIGANAVLIGAITIGDRAVIGAGAVVLHDVPPGATVAGNPARILTSSNGPKPS